MSKQTSSSERYEQAAALLSEYDRGQRSINRTAEPTLQDRLASALRALTVPPDVTGPTDDETQKIYNKAYYLAVMNLEPGAEAAHAAARRALYDAGIQGAHESWEPDDYAEEQGVIAAVFTALKERGNQAAADYVYENEDEVWGQHIGPMLDAIEESYGA